MPKLTKRVIDALPAKPAGGVDVFFWDTELRGFGVRIKASGSKSYFIQYRTAEGRQQRRMVLGRVGVLTPDEARRIARDGLAAVAKGGDPSNEKTAARTAMTVDDLCDWYLHQAEAGRLLGRNGKPVKASTLEMDRSRIETHVKPLIGRKAAQDLTVDDLEDMQAQIAAGKTAKPRAAGRGGITTGGPGVAARTLGMMRTIFQKGVRAKKIPHNPADGSQKIAGQRRRRRLSLDDIAALGIAMRAAEATGTSPTGLRAIRCMLLTGFRRMEVLGIKTSWLGQTPAGAYVNFPDTKSSDQVRPIGLVALRALREGAGDEWALPADRGNGHYIGVVKVLNRVCKTAKLVGITPHILRHTFASVAGDLGFSKLTIKGLLGHAVADATETYIHLDTALLAAADRVSRQIALKLDSTKLASVTIVTSSQSENGRG